MLQDIGPQMQGAARGDFYRVVLMLHRYPAGAERYRLERVEAASKVFVLVHELFEVASNICSIESFSLTSIEMVAEQVEEERLLGEVKQPAAHHFGCRRSWSKKAQIEFEAIQAVHTRLEGQV